MATSTEQMEATAKAANQTEQMASQPVGKASVSAGQATVLAPVQAPQIAEPIEAIGIQVDAKGKPIESQVAADSLVDSEEEEIVEALLGEGNPDELPANAEGVLLAQADTSSDEAPAESGEGSAEAEGESAGSGAMGAGQIGLIAAGAVGLVAASDSSSSSSSSSAPDAVETSGNTFRLTAVQDEIALLDGVTVSAVKRDDLVTDLENSELITRTEIGPILTTTERNEGVLGGDGFSTNGNDTVLSTDFDLYGSVIDLGAGSKDTLEIETTSFVSQTAPALAVGVEVVKISNQSQQDADGNNKVDVGETNNETDAGDVVAAGEQVVVSLNGVTDINSLIVDEASNATNGVDIVGVKNNAEVTLRGNFQQDTTIDFANTGATNLVLDSYFQNASELEVALDGSVLNLSSISSQNGVLNAIDSGAFATDNTVNLVELNITGDTDLELTGDGMDFRDATQAKVDASAFTGDSLTLDVAAHTDVAFEGSAADDTLSVIGADESGQNEISLDAQMGAGSNELVLNTVGAADTLVDGDSVLTAEGGTLAIRVEGSNKQDIDLRNADVSSVNSVTFADPNDGVVLTAAQVETIGISNFSTLDGVNADGQLLIGEITSNSALDLSGVDVGELVALQTADGVDVTLDSSAVLGNLKDGAGQIQILAESDDASLTMTADQFEQLADDEVVVAGLAGVGNAGNDPETNTSFEGTLTVTDVASDEMLSLDKVEVDGVTIQVGTTGETFTATTDFAITETVPQGGSDEATTLEVSGTTDLTNADLTAVDNLVLKAGSVLTINETDLEGADSISGAGEIRVVSDGDNNLTLDSTNPAPAPEVNALELGEIDIVFTADVNQTLTITGDESVTIQSVETTADVGTLTVDNDLTGDAVLTFTGASPAFDLHEDTTTFALNATGGNSTVIGAESDDPDTDVIEPSITGSGLTTIDVDGDDAEDSVDLGAISGVADAFSIDASGMDADATTSVLLDSIPESADYTLNGVTVTINDDADIGAGSSLNLLSAATVVGTADQSNLPIAADSNLTLTSDASAAEITSVLDTIAANTATIDVANMTSAQLTALAASPEKVNTAVGDLVINSDVAAADITTVLGFADFTAADTHSAKADLTGMNSDQLIAVGAEDGATGSTEFDTDGISGTFTLTADEAAEIGNILNDTIRSADVTVDAGATDDNALISGSNLEAIAGEISAVDTLTNLTYDDGAEGSTLGGDDDGLEARALLNATSDASVDADSISTAEKLAIAENVDSVADDGITNLDLDDGDAASTITNLLTKAVDASVNATTMSAAQLSAISAGASSIADAGISNLTVTSAQSAAEITNLLGKALSEIAAANTVDLTDMTAAQITAVEGAIDSVGTLSGETTAAVLQQLDTADTNVLDATDVDKVTGSLTDLQAVADADEQVITLDITDTGVNAAVDFDVNDAAGTDIAVTDVATLHDETDGDVTITEAVNISGTESNLTTELVTNSVVAATANYNITDAADDTDLGANKLVDLGDKTTGTVTIVNNTGVTGTETGLTNALVTASSKVETTSSDVIVEAVDAVTTESEQQVIEDIDSATTGTITVQAADGNPITLNFTDYQGDALIFDSGDDNDVITGSSNDDTFLIDGTNDEDVELDGGGGTDTIQITASTDFADTDDNIVNIANVTIDDGGGFDIDLSGQSDGFTITGGDSANAITGSSGVDIINGGAGADTLDGGDGDDTFVFNAGDGEDTINNFVVGDDDFDIDNTDGNLVEDGAGNSTVDIDGVNTIDTGADISVADGLQIVDNGDADIADADSLSVADIADRLNDTGDDDSGTAADDNIVSFANADDEILFAISDGTDTAIVEADAGGGDTGIEAGELTVLITLDGIGDAGTLSAANFDGFAA